MDLVFMNDQKEDIGVLKDYELDLAYGSEENNFACTVNINNHVCKEGYYLYFEDSEYGGVIDQINVNTKVDMLTYSGRTWHGILEGKILEPNIGDDYLVLSGDANVILGELITRMGLTNLFKVSQGLAGITISNYSMDRYITGYAGMRKMLRANGAKLCMAFKDGFVELSALPIVNYAENEQFDTDQIDFTITKKYVKLNHVICLGKGDLKERKVLHLYADQDGNVVRTPYYTGVLEMAETYDFPNAESEEELIKGGTKRIEEAWDANKVEFVFDSNQESFDIGDIVGAKELTTDISVSSDITKKIVTISNSETKISYKIGE